MAQRWSRIIISPGVDYFLLHTIQDHIFLAELKRGLRIKQKEKEKRKNGKFIRRNRESCLCALYKQNSNRFFSEGRARDNKGKGWNSNSLGYLYIHHRATISFEFERTIKVWSTKEALHTKHTSLTVHDTTDYFVLNVSSSFVIYYYFCLSLFPNVRVTFRFCQAVSWYEFDQYEKKSKTF